MAYEMYMIVYYFFWSLWRDGEGGREGRRREGGGRGREGEREGGRRGREEGGGREQETLEDIIRLHIHGFARKMKRRQ